MRRAIEWTAGGVLVFAILLTAAYIFPEVFIYWIWTR